MKHRRHHTRRNPMDPVKANLGKNLLAIAGGSVAAVAAKTLIDRYGQPATTATVADIESNATMRTLGLGLGTVAVGVALHYNNAAPRLGTALAAAGLGLTVGEYATRYNLEARILGCRTEGQTYNTTTRACSAAPPTCPTGQTYHTATSQCRAPCATGTQQLRDGTCGTPTNANPAGYSGITQVPSPRLERTNTAGYSGITQVTRSAGYSGISQVTRAAR